jgi:hypothetical protein
MLSEILNLARGIADQYCWARDVLAEIVIGKMLQICSTLRNHMGEVIVDKLIVDNLTVTERFGVDDVQCAQDGTEPVCPCLNMARR